MSVRRGDEDYEYERRQSLIDEDRDQIKKNTEHCRACREWHSPDEDCAPVDERN